MENISKLLCPFLPMTSPVSEQGYCYYDLKACVKDCMDTVGKKYS